MGAQLSAATREVTGVLVSVLDRHPAYRSSLVATLRRYQSDADITASQALQWTSEKLCKDLLDPMALQQPFTDALSASSQSASSSLCGLDKAALSSCIGRAAMLLLEELKLDLAVHARLFDCAAEGRLDKVRKLEPFVDMDYTDAQGATVSMLAAHYGHTPLLAYLLSLQPPPAVDAQDQFGWTALMHASRNGHLTCVRLLTAQSASVNVLNASRCSALMCAADNGHFAVVRHLLTRNAEVDAVSRSGDTALLQAAKGGHLSIMKALVAAGANVSHVGKKQQSAVVIAASQARWDIVEYLVSEGAAVDGVDDEGRSICHYEVKPTISQPLDATMRSAAAGSAGGQLAAAIQRGIVGRFNRTIQRSVQPAIVNRKLGAFHRQQLSNGHIHSTHSPSQPADDSIERSFPYAGKRAEGRVGSSTADEEEDEEDEGAERTTQTAATDARLTHNTRVNRASQALRAEHKRELGKRRRPVRRSRKQHDASESESKALGDDSVDVTLGKVVQGEDDEGEQSDTINVPHAPPAALFSSLSVENDDSAALLATLVRQPQSLSSPATSDLDLELDIDDDVQLLANGNRNERQSPSISFDNSQHRPHVISPTAAAGPFTSSDRPPMVRPVNPTPRQAAQHSHDHDGQPAGEEKDEQHMEHSHTAHIETTPTSNPTRTNSHGCTRSHRRHRSISTSPSQPQPRRSRPSTRSRLAALRQASFLPTSSAARALRQATEDRDEQEHREAEDDGWSDDQLEQPITQYNEREEQTGTAASVTSNTRSRSGSHHSIHQSPASTHSLSPQSSDSQADGTARSRHDSPNSSDCDGDSASHSSSSFDSSSSSSDSSLSSSASPRRSPVRPLHSRSATNSFKSVFSSRSRSNSFNTPTLFNADSMPPSPSSPSAAASSPSLSHRSSTPRNSAIDAPVLAAAIHITQSFAPNPADPICAADSDNIHLNPTPQPSPHHNHAQSTTKRRLQPPTDSQPQSHLHGPIQHRRAHSQPLAIAILPHPHAQPMHGAEQSGSETNLSMPPQPPPPPVSMQPQQQQQRPAAEADSHSARDQQHRLDAQFGVSKQKEADRATVVDGASPPSTPRLSPPHAESSGHTQPNSARQSHPDAALSTSTAASPAALSSSPSPPMSSSGSSPPSTGVSGSQLSLRPPPPIVLAHSDWRAHLDSTPVPAWLQHYRIEGAAYSALSHLAFRQLYSLTQDDCRRMLGRRKGEMLFACTRDYARKVQATYANRNKAATQQHVVSPAVSVSAPLSLSSATQASQGQHVTPVEMRGSSDGRSAAAREKRRRNGKARKKSSVHTAIVISPPDVPSAEFVFMPPTATLAPPPAAATAPLPLSPHTPAPTSHALSAADEMHTHNTSPNSEPGGAAATCVAATTHTATPSSAAAIGASPLALTSSPAAPTAASSVVRSVSLSPTPNALQQSSSFGALTDQLLDRSNAWLTRSVLSMFKDQQQQQQQQLYPQQQHTAQSMAGSAGVNSLISGTRVHARLSSILSGAGALHELDPQPF